MTDVVAALASEKGRFFIDDGDGRNKESKGRGLMAARGQALTDGIAACLGYMCIGFGHIW